MLYLGAIQLVSPEDFGSRPKRLFVALSSRWSSSHSVAEELLLLTVRELSSSKAHKKVSLPQRHPNYPWRRLFLHTGFFGLFDYTESGIINTSYIHIRYDVLGTTSNNPAQPSQGIPSTTPDRTAVRSPHWASPASQTNEPSLRFRWRTGFFAWFLIFCSYLELLLFVFPKPEWSVVCGVGGGLRSLYSYRDNCFEFVAEDSRSVSKCRRFSN